MDMLLKHAFQSLEPFRAALRSSFEYILNDGGGSDPRRRNKPAELLCKYMDRKLSGAGAPPPLSSLPSSSAASGAGAPGGGGGSEQETEAALDRALVLFRHIQGQDAFEVYYKKYLARRLLLERSSNDEQERTMIRKLKAECGANFTSKMEGMLLDMELSRDVAAAYAEYLQQQQQQQQSSALLGDGLGSPSARSGGGSRGRVLDAKISVGPQMFRVSSFYYSYSLVLVLIRC
jgi:cullin-4